MTVTAFLGAYGYGNLGDELCLIEAMRAFPASQAFAFSADAAWTMRCVPGLAACFREGAEMLALRPERIVFGGGMFGLSAAFATWMPWLARAQAQGAEVQFHNLGVARIKFDLSWLDATARGVIARAAGFSVRDYVSFEMIAEAGLGRMPRITFYPEADIPAAFDLADALLPRGVKLLGLSVIPLPLMRDCLLHDVPRVRALLAEFADHVVVPVISTLHAEAPEEDDMEGVRFLRHHLWPQSRLAAPELLDPGFWRAEMTPARLKGIIARCDALVTQRKHNAIHAIGAGVRAIGLHPLEDDSLRRTFVALSHRLPPGSRCVGLDAPPAEPG
jgi:hypothetical protein